MSVETSISGQVPNSTVALTDTPTGGASTSKYLDPTIGSDLTTLIERPKPRSTSAALLEQPSQWWRKHPASPVEVITGFQKWEGRVIEASSDFFTVELLPLEAAADGAPLHVDFEPQLLAPDRAEIGDVVYVTSRMVSVGRGMPISKTVSVRLRRLGRWTQEQTDEVRIEAHRTWTEVKDLFD